MPLIQLTFVTAEPVTPEYLARRVAEACALGGALRMGEGVMIPGTTDAFVRVEPQPIDAPGTLLHGVTPAASVERRSML
jgi:hypothetical protein